MLKQSTHKELWRHLAALLSQLCTRPLCLGQWYCHFGTYTGYVLKILQKRHYRASKTLVMLTSTEVSTNISSKPTRTSLLTLCNHRQKGKISLEVKCFLKIYLFYLGKWQIQHSGASHMLNNYTSLIHVNKGPGKGFGFKTCADKIPSTWTWPLLFLNNHDIILSPLQDTSWGIRRVKLIIITRFFWRRKRGKQVK